MRLADHNDSTPLESPLQVPQSSTSLPPRVWVRVEQVVLEGSFDDWAPAVVPPLQNFVSRAKRAQLQMLTVFARLPSFFEHPEIKPYHEMAQGQGLGLDLPGGGDDDGSDGCGKCCKRHGTVVCKIACTWEHLWRTPLTSYHRQQYIAVSCTGGAPSHGSERLPKSSPTKLTVVMTKIPWTTTPAHTQNSGVISLPRCGTSCTVLSRAFGNDTAGFLAEQLVPYSPQYEGVPNACVIDHGMLRIRSPLLLLLPARGRPFGATALRCSIRLSLSCERKEQT